MGYLVPEAVGAIEEEKERMVKTPWSEEEIPFSKAAEIGTSKVIREHSNVGLIITTDGSFGDIAAANFEEALQKTVMECEKQENLFNPCKHKPSGFAGSYTVYKTAGSTVWENRDGGKL